MNGSRSIEPEQMRMFLAVAEARSFTRAAAELGVSQQAASAAIKRLEAVVGRRVFERAAAADGLRLTQDGEALSLYGRQMLAISARIERHFAPAPIEGTIRLGFVDGFAATGLPIALGQLRRRHANLEIVAETGRTDALLRRLEAGGLDLVVGSQRPGAGLGEVVGTLALDWAGDTGRLGDPAVPVPLVLPPAPDPAREATLAALSGAGRSWVVRFESENRESRWAAVMAGLGVGLFARIDRTGEQPRPAPVLPEGGSIEVILRVADGADRFTEAFAGLVRAVVPAFASG
ncbi:MAG: LysR family transcriptional regulator [Gluconacetobacter diazotrophicus]|nr:LysR family transcriptional regulator [Gluconacetobacter diazotrophicus]